MKCKECGGRLTLVRASGSISFVKEALRKFQRTADSYTIVGGQNEISLKCPKGHRFDLRKTRQGNWE